MSAAEWIGVCSVVAILLIVIASSGASTMRAEKRPARLATVADTLGYFFGSRGHTDVLVESQTVIGDGWIRNVIEGRQEHLRIRVFDHEYEIGEDQVQQSIARVEGSLLHLPSFTLTPTGAFTGIAQDFGYRRGIHYNRREFSQWYVLHGADEPAIRQVFDDTVLLYFERHGGWTIESGGDWLLIYRARHLVPAAEIAGFIAQVKKIVALLSRPPISLT